MKYPDEWSATSLRLAMAGVWLALGLFNLTLWFTEPDHPPVWWLASGLLMVVAGVAGIVAWFRRRPGA